MLHLIIDKHYINIRGGLTDEFREALISHFSVQVPKHWFAKNQMIKKAQNLQFGLESTAKEKKYGEFLENRAKQWDGSKSFIYGKGRVIPTGFLYDLLTFLYMQGVPYTIEDNRKFLSYLPEDISVNGITLYPYQQQAISMMAEKGFGILHAGTGAGKTEISAGLIKKLNTPSTLFLTHRYLLSTQTTKRLTDRLGMPIGLIEGDIRNIQQVTVGMVPTIYNRLKKKDAFFLDYLASVELVIGDEIHLGTADSWASIFRKVQTPNVYGMSGTPFKKHVVDDMQLLATIGPEIFKIPTKWLIENGYLTPPILKIVPIKHVVDGDYDTVYRTCVIENEERHELIKKIVELDLTKQTLILVNVIEHGEILYERLKGLGAELIHSKIKRKKIDDVIQKFANKKQKILISTPLLDVGVDIPVLDKLLLCGGAGKAITSILQRIGRSLRISEGKVVAEVYDIADWDNKYLSEHFKERLAIYSDEDQQFKLEMCDIGNQL
jgi:superfamily II DNA or RNA helicase